MEQEANNQRIAELLFGWLKPTKDETEECLAKRWYELRHWTLHRTSNAPIENFSSYYWTPPDFHNSETLNALALEKLRLSGCRIQLEKEVHVWGPLVGGDKVWLFETVYDVDRKTAIVNAALKLIDNK